MSNIDTQKLDSIFTDCFFKEDEAKTDLAKSAVLAQGLIANYGFHPERLESHRDEVREMLAQLPHQFMEGSGEGGWSFLNAVMDSEGQQWGEQASAEKLMVLGIALGEAEYLMPREMWKMFPGGVPYFKVKSSL